jgi:hypothetical protein
MAIRMSMHTLTVCMDMRFGEASSYGLRESLGPTTQSFYLQLVQLWIRSRRKHLSRTSAI